MENKINYEQVPDELKHQHKKLSIDDMKKFLEEYSKNLKSDKKIKIYVSLGQKQIIDDVFKKELEKLGD